MCDRSRAAVQRSPGQRGTRNADLNFMCLRHNEVFGGLPIFLKQSDYSQEGVQEVLGFTSDFI